MHTSRLTSSMSLQESELVEFVCCVHVGRPEVVTLNNCYNWPVLFRATHIFQENVGEHMPVAYWKDTISGFMFP